MRISKEEYRKNIHRLQRFLDGDKNRLLAEMRQEMADAAKELHFEEAARLRDEIEMLESLDQRGKLETHVQPEVFPIDPKRGLAGLRKVLHLAERPRTIEGIDIAHIAGTETVAAVVQFHRRAAVQAGLQANENPQRHGARRRGQHPRGRAASLPTHSGKRAPPDILLIDGGKGQLHAAMAALAALGHSGQKVVALAKREELVFTPDADEPLALSRHSYALRLLQYVRDEAHRFAQHYHHLLRRRSQLGEDGR